MKDMIPEQMLGGYFSKRSRYTQTLNVVRRIMRTRLKSSMKDAIIIGNLITRNHQLRAILKLRKRKRQASDSTGR